MAFEKVALSALLGDEQYARKVVPYLKEEYFLDSAQKEVFKFIKYYINKYNARPTKEALAIMINDANLPEAVFDNMMNTVSELEHNSQTSLEWLVEHTEKWAKDQAIYNAIMKSIGVIDGTNKDLDKNSIPSLLMDALAVNFDSYIGHSYFEEAEAQWAYLHNVETKFPFSCDMLNRVTKGGVPNKTLNVIMAGINVGKTTFLVQQAADWLSAGKNVLYFTLEVAENVIRERIDVSLMDMTFDQVKALEKAQYLSRVNKLRESTQGELYIKEFPSGSAHVGHFRHVIEELKIKKGFIPDVIIIDYLTICSSSKLRADAKGNTNTYFTSVAEELRALGVEYGVPLWTAAQFGRSGQTSDNVDMTDVGLALGIAATADFMVSFMQPEELASRSQVIGKVLKNRYSNKATIGKFLMGLDSDKQRYLDIDPNEQRAVMTEDELIALSKPLFDASKSNTATQGWSFA